MVKVGYITRLPDGVDLVRCRKQTEFAVLDCNRRRWLFICASQGNRLLLLYRQAFHDRFLHWPAEAIKSLKAEAEKLGLEVA